MTMVRAGVVDADLASTLAARLARLGRMLRPADLNEIAHAAGGVELNALVGNLLQSVDADVQTQKAVEKFQLPAGRERTDYTDRYPELNVLGRLPAGTLVDGELVTFDAEGRPDLARLLRRHGLTGQWKIGLARRSCPVHYVLFDLLYHRGRCLLREPLARRREVLDEACRRLEVAEVLFSEAVVGQGKALYAAALARGHEGVVAKHLASVYRPGATVLRGGRSSPVGRELFSAIPSYQYRALSSSDTAVQR